MNLFFMNLVSSSLLGAYNVVPLLWLVSTLTNQCGAPSNLWFQKRTNVSKPHDKILCYIVGLDLSVAPNKAQPSKALHGHAQHTFNP
jgi:hypothetical protein